MDPVGSLVALPEAERIIEARIAPGADAVDRLGVRRSSIDALAAGGFLGTPLPAPQQRELAELIARADASTWFCWGQHQSATALVAEGAPSPSAQRWLADLQAGRALAAVAFAHVRRPGPPNPVATRVAGGWRIDGTLDWVTSWDIADVLVMQVAIADDPSRYACFAIEAGLASGPLPAGMTLGDPLALLAMSGTHTRPVRFDACVLPDSAVCAMPDASAWHAMDDDRTSDANPAAFGVARGALRELAGMAEHRPELRETVDALAAEVRHVRERAYALAGHGDREERLTWRVRALDACLRSSVAVVTARAGASMMRGTPAERRVREALFLQVQAQTAASRARSLSLAREQARG